MDDRRFLGDSPERNPNCTERLAIAQEPSGSGESQPNLMIARVCDVQKTKNGADSKKERPVIPHVDIHGPLAHRSAQNEIDYWVRSILKEPSWRCHDTHALTLTNLNRQILYTAY